MSNSPATPANYWLRSGFLTLLERGSGMVFSLGTAVLLLRALSKEEFAAWGLFILVTYFLEMGRTGLIQNGLVRFLTIHRQEPATYSAITTASLFLNFAFSIASNLLLWLGMSWFIEMYHAPQLAVVLPVYFVTNFVMALFYHYNFVQQANFEFRGIFWSTFWFRGALFAWVAFCKITGQPIVLQHLALAMLAGAVLGAAGSYRFAQKHLNHARRVDFQWVGKLISYGKFVLGTNVSTMFYKNMDKLALGHLIGPAAFAVYDAAGKVTQMIEAPSFSIAAVVFPQSAERMEREGTVGVKHLYERSVGATLAIILPFLVFVLIFAQPIILLFAGPQYLESAGILQLTAFFGVFMPFAVQFGTILDSTGRPATNFVYTTFTAVINLGLSYLFVHRFGLVGAALATLTGYAISFVFMQHFLYKKYGINALRAFQYIPGFYMIAWNLLKRKLGIHSPPPLPHPLEKSIPMAEPSKSESLLP